MDYKLILGILSVILAFIAYGLYFYDIFSKRIKPHAFSWLIWALAGGIVFFAQLSKGAGSGAWAIGAVSLSCLLIFILALRMGEKRIVLFDWIFLFSAITSLFLWWLTDDPKLSVILITISDVAGIFPTLRKAYHRPYEESYILFSLGSLRSLLSVIALESYTLTTTLHPTALIFSNLTLAAVIFIFRMNCGGSK